MESILTSIKKMLGITEDYEHFDSDLIMHINSVFSILTQLGVGPSEGFSIKKLNINCPSGRKNRRFAAQYYEKY